MVGALDAVAQIRPLRVVRAAQFDVRREAARRHNDALGRLDGHGVARFARRHDAASLAVFVHKDFGRAGVQHHVHVVVAVDVVHVGLEEASAQRFNRLVGARPQTAGHGEQTSRFVLELHAQIHQPLHAVPRIAHQRVHQQGVALIVTAGKRLGVVPFDRVVVGNRLLRAVVDCIQRAASEDGIAADLAHLFQHQHLGAELIRLHSRRQTSAAAADDHDFRLDGDVLRLFDDSLHLRRPLHGVQTRLGHSVQHSRHDGIGGLGRARNRVNVRGLLLDDETRNLRHSRIRNAGGVAILGHFDGGHCTVFIHGHSHFNGTLATDFAVAHARKDAGLRTRSAAQRQQHRQRQQERKELLHGSPPCSFGRNGRRSICRIFYYTITRRWLARGNDAFFTSKIGDFCKKKGFRQEFRGLRANCVLGKSKSGIAPGGKEELSDG